MKETPFLHLPKYEDADPQDLRDGYNKLADLIDQYAQRTDMILTQIQNGR